MNGLLKILDSLIKSFLRPLVPEEAAFQIQLIGVGICVITSVNLLLFTSGEAHTQIGGNILRKLFLQPGNFRNVALIPSAPKLGTPVHIYQFRLQDNVIAVAVQAPGEY